MPSRAVRVRWEGATAAKAGRNEGGDRRAVPWRRAGTCARPQSRWRSALDRRRERVGQPGRLVKRRREAGGVCPGWTGKRWAGVPVARRVTEGGAPDRRAAGRAFVQTGREAGEVRPAERRVTEGHLIEEDGGAGHPSEERTE